MASSFLISPSPAALADCCGDGINFRVWDTGFSFLGEGAAALRGSYHHSEALANGVGSYQLGGNLDPRSVLILAGWVSSVLFSVTSVGSGV